MSDMDKGAFISSGYTVDPGEGGSFVVYQGGLRADPGRYAVVRGFSNWLDLTSWLVEEHRVNSQRFEDGKAQPPSYD